MPQSGLRIPREYRLIWRLPDLCAMPTPPMDSFDLDRLKEIRENLEARLLPVCRNMQRDAFEAMIAEMAQQEFDDRRRWMNAVHDEPPRRSTPDRPPRREDPDRDRPRH